MTSLEEQARLLLDAAVYDFVAAGAGTESGLAANEAGWQDVRLRPRRLVDVSDVSTAGDVLGVPVEAPVVLAPAGLHRLLHAEAEQATARGAAAASTAMCLATRATTNVQDVVPLAPGRVWLQVYVATDRNYTSDVLRAAIAAGVTRVVVTVDRAVAGARPRSDRHAKPPLPDGAFEASHLGSGLRRPRGVEYDLALTFDDLAWVAEHGIAVTVKGILRGDDARRCLEHGADSIIVSNHGGRQIDAAVPTSVALREVVNAINAPVLVDGGIRSGTDVLRALALGAHAVLIGRPYLWALATGGADGVGRVLAQFQTELHQAMTLTGCRRLTDITRDLAVP